MSEEIQSLRQQINEVDEQLAELFDRRMTISKGVALYKKEHNLPIFDKEREQQVLARVVEAYPHRDQAFHKSLVTFFQTVMDLSKESQKQWMADNYAQLGGDTERFYDTIRITSEFRGMQAGCKYAEGFVRALDGYRTRLTERVLP